MRNMGDPAATTAWSHALGSMPPNVAETPPETDDHIAILERLGRAGGSHAAETTTCEDWVQEDLMNKHVRMHHHPKRLVAVPATVNVTISGTPPRVQLGSTDIPIQKVGNDYMLTFNNTTNRGDGFEVTFTIDDQTGLGYGFFQDPAKPSLNDAISVKVIGSSGHCPKPGQKWVGFRPTSLARPTKSGCQQPEQVSAIFRVRTILLAEWRECSEPHL